MSRGKKADGTEEVREARAVAKYLRYSARKGRLVADMIRGKAVDEAITLLTVSKKAAARKSGAKRKK